jgi:hypothetical protein
MAEGPLPPMAGEERDSDQGRWGVNGGDHQDGHVDDHRHELTRAMEKNYPSMTYTPGTPHAGQGNGTPTKDNVGGP